MPKPQLRRTVDSWIDYPMSNAGAIEERYREHTDAWKHAESKYEPYPGEITPQLINEYQIQDWARATRKIASPGASVLSDRAGIAIGSVSWNLIENENEPFETLEGEDRQERDDRIIESLELPQLARRLVREWIVRGVMASLPYQLPHEKTPRIGRVTGYLEPLFDPDNLDMLVGLLQIKKIPGKTGHSFMRNGSYWIRIYDWSYEALEEAKIKDAEKESRCVLTEWVDIANLKAAKPGKASRLQEVTLRPVVTHLDPNDEGEICSDFMLAVPFMRGVLASDIGLERGEELAGYPIPVFENAGRVDAVSAAIPIEVQPGGKFYWAEPGNLDVLEKRLEGKRSNLARVMSLPAHKVGAQVRSAETIREENVKFFNKAQEDATEIAEHLTRLLASLSAVGLPLSPHDVVVAPNRDYIRESIIGLALEALKVGAIPVEAAAKEIQPFFLNWKKEDMDDWLTTRELAGTPEEVINSINEQIATELGTDAEDEILDEELELGIFAEEETF